MSWMTLRILIALCILNQTGCVQIRNRIDECAIKTQDKKTTKRSWSYHSQFWESEPHFNDFRIGFKAGYLAALNGEDCPPAIPPRFYWSAKNNDVDANDRTNSWFRGWWMGSVAATSDGLFDHREIQIAPRLHQQSNKPEIVWPESNRSGAGDSNLLPIPDVPTQAVPDLPPSPDVKGSPLVPPAVDPLKKPDKEYSPSPKKI